MSASPPVIRTSGLTKRFGDFTAVDDLVIEVAGGSIFAFLGANGSGKSTTIRMLIGLLRPTAGTVEVAGIDVIRHPRRVRDHIGYMGQRVSLYQGLTLRENVEFYAGLYGLSAADLERRWGPLRERFSLARAERDQAEDLPVGIRQRAGLALTSLHAPRLLFLDEPTAGVDVHDRALFWEWIHERAAAGVTVFVTTHYLEEVDYCDRVAFIDAGRLIANDEPEAIRSRYSPGYRIDLELPAEAAGRLRSRLGPTAAALETTARGFRLTVPALERALLERLGALACEEPEGRVRISRTEMTEIFRTLLAEARR
jgi:ABC-2 type transport system ATP-binding protein